MSTLVLLILPLTFMLLMGSILPPTVVLLTVQCRALKGSPTQVPCSILGSDCSVPLPDQLKFLNVSLVYIWSNNPV